MLEEVAGKPTRLYSYLSDGKILCRACVSYCRLKPAADKSL
ncbi:MAG: hypothetical protein NZ929_03180 [Aigarchaeota archaeon]|nr:hypothetical protein [Aigarchaeota archaeon]MCX8192621.1 hypothetical protein [Nitrososphaeria archaeon]